MKNTNQPYLTRRLLILLPSLLFLLSITPFYGLESKVSAADRTPSTLYFHIVKQSNVLSIRAELGDLTKTTAFGKESGSLIDSFHYLYSVLDNRGDHNTAFQNRLDHLSARILAPFKSLINKSQRIIFIIDPEFIRFPLDLLKINGNYLFLQKPVIYGFQKLKTQNPAYLPPKDSAGLIVRDATADPEDGCMAGKNLFQNSSYYNTAGLKLDQLSGLAGIDFVLMSVHGMIAVEKSDYIIINGERLQPDFLNQFHPKFIYLDSCRLGVSYSFISNAMKSGTIFYLGPIVINEAGNSSTKTIQYFFQEIAAGNSFGDSLFQTRVRLYDEFKENVNASRLFWYCFPFRVYWLNEYE
ncbi:MAG: hypothetical protein K6U80_13740 [Firmicutes bacterium]|nr:hypothetical protein [Bacillota bacterium]